MIRWLLRKAGFSTVVLEVHHDGQLDPDDIETVIGILAHKPPDAIELITWDIARILYRSAEWFGTQAAKRATRHLETEVPHP